MLRVLDLFSGIGGFSLGLERTGGFRTVAFCEIEPFPRKVLAKHWPNVPIFEDVMRLHAEDMHEPIDVICGGYPCQPFSLAGKRRGAEDDRHLWPEIARLLREFDAIGRKPDWCLFENVAGHVNMGLDQVLSDLESQDYTAWPVIIPACGVDAPHRRDRVWIIANSNGTRRYRDEEHKICSRRGSIESCERFVPDTGQQLPQIRTERKRDGRRGDVEQHSCVMANSSRDMLDWIRIARETGRIEFAGGSVVIPDTANARIESVQTGEVQTGIVSIKRRLGGMVNGFSRWLDEPEDVPRVIGGQQNRINRLRALGNAVVPQIVEVIGRAILEAEKYQQEAI